VLAWCYCHIAGCHIISLFSPIPCGRCLSGAGSACSQHSWKQFVKQAMQQHPGQVCDQCSNRGWTTLGYLARPPAAPCCPACMAVDVWLQFSLHGLSVDLCCLSTVSAAPQMQQELCSLATANKCRLGLAFAAGMACMQVRLQLSSGLVSAILSSLHAIWDRPNYNEPCRPMQEHLHKQQEV
jgi:hypothetical protein